MCYTNSSLLTYLPTDNKSTNPVTDMILFRLNYAQSRCQLHWQLCEHNSKTTNPILHL